MKPMTSWKRLWLVLRAERQEVRSIYTFGLFQGLVGLSLPLGIQAVITFLQAGQLSTSWYVLVFLVLSGILIGGYLQLKQITVTETIEQRLFANTAYHFADRLPRIQLGENNSFYMPEMMNRFFEVAIIQKGISKMLIDFSAAIIQVLFGVLVLSLYHPAFVLIAVILFLCFYLFFRYSGPKGLQTSLRESKHKYALAHWLQEVARSLKTFKLAGDSTLPLNKADHITNAYLDARNGHFQVLVTQYKALIFFKVILAGILLILGSVLVINNQINIGQFVAAEIIILLLIQSIEKIMLSMSTVYDVLTSLDKLGTAIDLPVERESGQRLTKQNEPLSLDVTDLSFAFDDAQEPLLKQLNFSLKPGQTMCIKGTDGSGKTTLVRLLSGYYAHYQGNIAYNNISLTAIDLSDLRAQLGENFAEHDIFQGTLRENLTCGRPIITDQDALDALEKADLIPWFQCQKNGLETAIRPEGYGLPGHIRRRLMLARSFAGQPRMIIAEDNPNLQGVAERKIFYDLLFKYCQKITTLIVTNDQEIASRCERIFELKNGQLIEQIK
jgi:ABC-type bacteriocin/lantibiotic exporter with double-glycine peptidase domain